MFVLELSSLGLDIITQFTVEPVRSVKNSLQKSTAVIEKKITPAMLNFRQ